MSFINIERFGKNISNAPMRVKLYVGFLALYYFASAFFIFSEFDGDLAIGVVIFITLVVVLLLLYESLKGLKIARNLVSLGVLFFSIVIFGFWIGLFISIALNYYFFYSNVSNRFYNLFSKQIKSSF